MEPLAAPPPTFADVGEARPPRPEDSKLTRTAGVRAVAACSMLVGLVVLLLAGGGSDQIADDGTSPSDMKRVVVSPQCNAPYVELGTVRDGEWCAGLASAGTGPTCTPLRDWRQMNELPRRVDGAADRQWARRCDQSLQGRGLSGQSAGGAALTDVGGDNWYRFTSVDHSGVQWDSLPTQPMRADQDARLSRRYEQLSPQGITGACGADATAWVSGWPAEAAGRPPLNYSVPGSLPGDGPQYFPDTANEWQEYVVCFEGALPVPDEQPPPPPPPTAAGAGPVRQMTSGVLYELWRDVEGSTVPDLGASDRFPDHPSERHVVGGDEFDINTLVQGDGVAYFESPTDIADHIGTRMRGYFRAPEDGCYSFVLATDDDGELWVGDVLDGDTSKDPHSVSAGDDTCDDDLALALVASVPGWALPRAWDRFPEQVSSPIALRRGQFVLLDAFAKEWEGGDNLAVAVTLPSGQFLGPIPVSEYMFLDAELLRIATTPLAAPPDRETGAGTETETGTGTANSYHTCLASVRVRVVHCDSFLLWQLPDAPSCDPLALGYCTVPSGLFDV